MKNKSLYKVVVVFIILITLTACSYNSHCEHEQHPFRNQNFIMSLITGHRVSMVIMENGSLWGWGDNSYGAIGDGTTEDRNMPVKIMDDVRMADSAFGVSMAVKNDNTLWAWGDNSRGLYGNITTEDSRVPLKVMDDVIFVSIGGNHVAAIKSDNSLWVWGTTDQYEYYDMFFPRIPTMVMSDVVYVSAGLSGHTMVITEDRTLWGWGINNSGELGIGVCEVRLLPQPRELPPVRIMDNVAQVITGGEITGAVTLDGALWAWGNNQVGGVGDGTNRDRYYPVRILEDIKYMSLTTALTSDGVMWAWGMRIFGYGTETINYYPVKITDSVAMISSMGHTLIKKNDETLWVWGNNSSGQLGIYSLYYSLSPVRVHVN